MAKNWLSEQAVGISDAAMDTYKTAQDVFGDYYGPPTGIYALRGPALAQFVTEIIKAYPPQPWVTPQGQVVNASSWLIWIQDADPKLAAKIREALMPTEEGYA